MMAIPSTHKFLPHVEGLNGCYVAGGAITSTFTNKPVADIDIYPKSWEALEDAIQWAFDAGLWCVFASSRAMTFAAKSEETPNVQIMLFDTFETSAKIFTAFDFTCCMGAFDLDAKSYELHDDFVLHCAQRFISFNPSTRFPYASAWRVRKYEEKGFTIGRMEFNKILMACAEKPIRSWDELKEQIGGVYGEAFDVPVDQEFSMQAAFAAMATLQPKSPEGVFTSADEAITLISPVERDFFETTAEDGKPCFWVKIDGEFRPMPVPPRVGRRVPPFNGGVFFKKVKRKDGKLLSHYKPSFEYRVGQTAESASPYLWVVQTPEAAKEYNIWAGSGDWVVIEIHADPEDIITNHHEIKIKKGTVVREVVDLVREAA